MVKIISLVLALFMLIQTVRINEQDKLVRKLFYDKNINYLVLLEARKKLLNRIVWGLVAAGILLLLNL